MRRLVRVQLPARLAVLPSLLREPFHAVASWSAPGRPAAGEVALFVHYDPAGQVAPRVCHFLTALNEAGLSVFFVSNTGRAELAADPGLRTLCAGILVRRNIGYDFGAMREGLAHWQLPHPATRMLVLANDSVLGPFRPLDAVFRRIDFDEADFWGATDSLQRGYHVQSWFLVAGRKAMDHPGWARFWDGVRPVQSKEWVVGHYEVALTRALQRCGLRVRALWPYSALTAHLIQPEQSFASVRHVQQLARVRRLIGMGYLLNPTADLWRQLLAAGCPFIKRELVERNPAGIMDAADWADGLAEPPCPAREAP